MTKTEKNGVTRAAYEMMRSLGGMVGTSCRVAKDLGRSIEGNCRALTEKTSSIMSWRPRREELPVPEEKAPDFREEIRSIVTEELARSRAAEPCVTLAEIEKRLRLMADTIEAIQKKIAELSDHGLEEEELVSTAMAWVDNVNLLNDGERALLTTIFRQNMEIQKPQRAKTAGDAKRKGVTPNVRRPVQSEVG